MVFEEKKVVLKNGAEAILKTPEIEDAAKLLESIKTCSAETDFLSKNADDWALATVESEEEWIRSNREAANRLVIACYVESEIAGSCDIHFHTGSKSSHRALLGIAIRKKYWNIGVGSAMFRELMKAAQENEKTEIVELEFIEGNDRAKALYEKFGLKAVSMTPKYFRLKDGTYQNIVYMQKIIK